MTVHQKSLEIGIADGFARWNVVEQQVVFLHRGAIEFRSVVSIAANDLIP